MLTACDEPAFNPDAHPVARVYDRYLYVADISDMVPDYCSEADSIVIAGNYIETWMKRQLKLRKAEENLTDDEMDITKPMENYRASLLVYRYEKNLIAQKLDTLVTEDEIRNYYNKFAGQFRLNDNIVAANYVKIDRNAPEMYKVRNLLRSDKEGALTELQRYCEEYADEYSLDKEWIYFNSLTDKYPIHVYGTADQFLKYNNFIETKDSTYRYFIDIKEFRTKNDTTPLYFVRNDIITIVRNKKRMSLIRGLENDMFQTAKKQGHLEIY
ncbi:MAG: hypothetical protein KJ607_07370 [Bacteroidetes bacterium]|nr:hypothetical protein [Bacteroidota bacterium]